MRQHLVTIKAISARQGHVEKYLRRRTSRRRIGCDAAGICLAEQYIKSSPGDEPVLAFMPGGEWQKRLDDMSKTLQPLADEIKASEQK